MLDVSASVDNYRFNSWAISSFDVAEDKFKKKKQNICYHYTSPNALLSILSKTPTLRFTDVRFMNDHSEMVFCVKCILEFLFERKQQYPFCLEAVNNLLLKKYTVEDYLQLKLKTVEFEESFTYPCTPTRCFVFCMCEDDDLLNMWNYYVHGGKYEGYNIGFDVYEFLKSFDSNNPSVADPIIFRFGKILYNEKMQKSEIEKVLNQIENSSNDQNALDYRMIRLRQYIESFGVFYKAKSFSGEKEYRITLEIAENRIRGSKENYYNGNLKKISLDFSNKNGLIVPFLNVPINKNAIKQITISPTVEAEIAKKGLQNFLDMNNYEAEIKQSDIPIRF